MKLGIAVQIVRGVIDLDGTLSFYEKLGYKKLAESSSPNKWALFTDGRVNLLIDEGNMKYTGLIYYNPDFREIIPKLEKQGIKFLNKMPKTGAIPESATFMDLDNLGVNILNSDYNLKFNPDIMGKSEVMFGKFGEFASSVKDLDSKINFWTKLGYEVLLKEGEPEPWAILVDGLMVLGFHQTEWGSDSNEPALTYFDPNMEKILSKLQKDGIDVEKFQDAAIESGNGVVTAPDGLKIFLFKGDI